MKELCKVAGISKQALWSHNKRKRERCLITDLIIGEIEKIRKDHKRMGSRRMYFSCKESIPVGRDIFERTGLENGFRLKRLRNIQKTTWSQRVEVYPNRIEGITINGINQVWQSDIFYISIEGIHNYGVCIEDVYSRKILAIHLSKSLSAEQLLKALRIAIRTRGGNSLAGCIFHSDRGSQYIDQEVKEFLKDNKMLGSMCKLPQENAYVERVQGIIKYEYLFVNELTNKNKYKQIRKSISLYNDKRPHSSLGMMTPTAFEESVENMDENLRPEMKIYQWNHDLSTISEVFNKRKKKQKRKSQHNK
jgi:transposase InsO family protein